MFIKTASIVLTCLSALASIVNGQNSTSATKVGWTGVLSSLDGGLGGTVTVLDPTTLMISGYTLKDASAPALYWWGTTDGTIKDGFRISNMHVTTTSPSPSTITIKIDAGGHTTADFSTVGLWCEQLNANFGQATLAVPSGSSSSPTSSMSPPASPKSDSTSFTASLSAATAALIAACVFTTWMV